MTRFINENRRQFAFLGSDIFRFKRSIDASFFIFDVSPSIRKASSDLTNSSEIFQKRLESALVNKFFRNFPKTFRVCACYF